MKLCILDVETLGYNVDTEQLKEFGSVEVYGNVKDKEVSRVVKNQEIIITNKVVLNENNLKEALNLKMICIIATGTNNVDLDYCRSRNIAVTNVAGYSTDSVAQHAFAMLFYLLEHLRYYDDFTKTGEYSRHDLFTHIGQEYGELTGKTWGIVGLGAIGQKVARIAQAFGCRILYYSASGKNCNLNYERVELEELLKSSDVISIHAPLNEYTNNLLDYEKLSLMKKSAILLNLGRGGIINEKDLAKALDEGLIGGAGLDVLKQEPPDLDNPLFKIKRKDRLLITPHIAWGSIEARRKLMHENYLNIKAFFSGENRNRVD